MWRYRVVYFLERVVESVGNCSGENREVVGLIFFVLNKCSLSFVFDWERSVCY